jgi:hypothetical protein
LTKALMRVVAQLKGPLCTVARGTDGPRPDGEPGVEEVRRITTELIRELKGD